jgi:hypothetical protein
VTFPDADAEGCYFASRALPVWPLARLAVRWLAVASAFTYIETVGFAAKVVGGVRADWRRAVRWAAGIAALVGAIEQLVVGNGWNALWFGLLAALVLRPRRAWRVNPAWVEDDPESPRYLASEHRRMALIFLAVTVGLCVLSVAYFTGVVVQQDNARGLVGLTGAIVSFFGALSARSYYREAMQGD